MQRDPLVSHSEAPMNWHMVHFSEIESLRASEQFLAFSEAYLDSAARLCALLAASPAESTYPRGAVVLSLAFHGIELFMKAAILEKSPSEQFNGHAGHDLDHLDKMYVNLYRGKKYAFDSPFRAEETHIVNLNPRIVEERKDLILKHKRATPMDQLHRYPRGSKGKPLEGIYAFEANSFAADLTKAQQDIARLKELIFHG
jgi:hypothetical protein